MPTGGVVLDLHQCRIKVSMILIYGIFITFQLLRRRFLPGQINSAGSEVNRTRGLTS